MPIKSLLVVYLFIFITLTRSHYFPPPSSSSSSVVSASTWQPARATFYAPLTDPPDSAGGACGYSTSLLTSTYGRATAALSPSLFLRGQICGACFQIRCADDLKFCIPGTSMIVTATTFCPPNPYLQSHPCNSPNNHFVLAIEAFEKIALWKAGNVPVQYKRVACRREGGVKFTVTGHKVFVSVLIWNVGGDGDVSAVKVKGARTGWLSMGRNWGVNWQINADLKGQALSFEVTSGGGVTLTSYNAAPKEWEFGQTFEGKQFDS